MILRIMFVYAKIIILGLRSLRFAREIVKELFLKMELVSVQKVLNGTILLNNVCSSIVGKSVLLMVLQKMD